MTLGAFQPFGVTHGLVSGGCVALMALVVFLGRRWSKRPAGLVLHRGLLGVVALVQVVNIVYFASPPQLDPATSLPLHVCDLAGIVAVVSLATGWRWAQMVMLYWGVGLSSQGLITPVIEEGPETFRFWLFFASHWTMIATGLYEWLVRGYIPSWRDFRWMCAISLGYAGIVSAINLPMGWNYGYLGRTKPGNPTLIDKLGPWPWRMIWMYALGVVVYSLVTVVGRFVGVRLRPRVQSS